MWIIIVHDHAILKAFQILWKMKKWQKIIGYGALCVLLKNLYSLNSIQIINSDVFIK
jgi:hypothetical protein